MVIEQEPSGRIGVLGFLTFSLGAVVAVAYYSVRGFIIFALLAAGYAWLAEMDEIRSHVMSWGYVGGYLGAFIGFIAYIITVKS